MAARAGLGRTAVFVCDIQETFRPLVANWDSVVSVAHTMLGAASALSVPVVVTEQYPKAFGHTAAELDLPAPGAAADLDDGTLVRSFEKTLFSMVTPEVEALLADDLPEVKNVVLMGLEGHICVQQTALDLVDRGYTVHALADGIGSQRLYDRNVALDRMRAAGVVVTTSQSLIYELIRDAKSPAFKACLNVVKNPLHPDADPLL
ncbi:isochorismatase domain-containing protein 1 [Thecamonas trahens ATCC 50062]|uniref:Isochorismatase domain-containing protein 1 n=1 Tax=Thecamonas trahens ATCC 50062 TaxID=461836 RepID=A0A0L0DQA2_THETB|nr:isochorismatase domain-containing protein 1 [Thecamonas trahens ATCC 50062]KNC54482.1 isochorismatase domain-containing protein 1 [Thecamonas trahens ATCC 50062]|eukprot:XP_013753636.1 isochorismatase domain-containing protein 1 [Thecamonas trahens ATCC 50062]